MAEVTKAALLASITALINDGGEATAAEVRSILTDIVDSASFEAGSIDGLTDPEILDLAADYISYQDTSEGGARKSLLEALFYYKKDKDEVIAASTANGTLATDFESGDTLDGVTLVANYRILLKDQSAGSENGIYIVNTTGAPTRAKDFNTSTKVKLGSNTYVQRGTENATKTFTLTSPIGTIAIGSSNLVFTDLNAGSGDVTAASTFGTDNALIRADGTGKGVQSGGVSLSDSDIISGLSGITGDGADLQLNGGTAAGSAEGSVIILYDKDAGGGNADLLKLFAGSTNNGSIQFLTGGSGTPKASIDSNGDWDFQANTLDDVGEIHLATQTPASASATGTTGTITWDANYIYVCTATDTWKRVAIATW